MTSVIGTTLGAVQKSPCSSLVTASFSCSCVGLATIGNLVLLVQISSSLMFLDPVLAKLVARAPGTTKKYIRTTRIFTTGCPWTTTKNLAQIQYSFSPLQVSLCPKWWTQFYEKQRQGFLDWTYEFQRGFVIHVPTCTHVHCTRSPVPGPYLQIHQCMVRMRPRAARAGSTIPAPRRVYAVQFLKNYLIWFLHSTGHGENMIWFLHSAGQWEKRVAGGLLIQWASHVQTYVLLTFRIHVHVHILRFQSVVKFKCGEHTVSAWGV